MPSGLYNAKWTELGTLVDSSGMSRLDVSLMDPVTGPWIAHQFSFHSLKIRQTPSKRNNARITQGGEEAHPEGQQGRRYRVSGRYPNLNASVVRCPSMILKSLNLMASRMPPHLSQCPSSRTTRKNLTTPSANTSTTPTSVSRTAMNKAVSSASRPQQ